jgi:pimeloyl-ACP methyl ester carboxylesterase
MTNTSIGPTDYEGGTHLKILRTPDARFTNLPGFAFDPHYCEVTDADGTRIRIHYLDEGAASAPPVLLMHGEPSWSFLYRKIVASLAARGHRVVAPDLVGFGRSDKPSEQSDYTFERHVRWMSDWLAATRLTNITLFCQDWGRPDWVAAGGRVSGKIRARRGREYRTADWRGIQRSVSAMVGIQPEHTGFASRADCGHGKPPRTKRGGDGGIRRALSG